VYCSVLQRVAVYCSVLQCDAARCTVLQCIELFSDDIMLLADVECGVCDSVCCSALRCIAFENSSAVQLKI